MGRRAAQERVYAACRARVEPAAWEALLAACADRDEPWPGRDLPERVASVPGLPPWLAALAEVERAREEVRRASIALPPVVEAPAVNPTLGGLELDWRLGEALGGDGPPARGAEVVLVWRDARGEVLARAASPRDLLALKMVVDGLTPEAVEACTGAPRAGARAALRAAARADLVLLPPSRLRRDPARVPPGAPGELVTAGTFCLQWHLTNACELRCAHCYDRSPRPTLSLDRALRVVDDLERFCADHGVEGHVALTGGNPMLFPGFLDLYAAIVRAGLGVTILGNPTSRRRLERLVELGRPYLYQVSLEGLEARNDSVRGPGHFARVMEFLPLLRQLGIYSAVMLTLTRDNLGEVLPLGELLRGRADQLTFTRLAPFGEGARLALPDPAEYRAFLERYVAAAAENPALGFKDNLVNVARAARGEPPCGGCTGFGCGAAFNCLSLLPDGEAHACRKLPSPVGNVLEEGLRAVYRSPAAAAYRAGPAGCAGCDLRHACAGCMAVTAGLGLDPLVDRDPFCAYPGAPPI